jgi:phosphonate transport system substrate-binding protein
MRPTCFVLLLSLLLAIAPAQAEVSLEKVVIALKPDKNPDQMLTERTALSDYLRAKLEKPVEVTVPLSSAVILEGFANGTIDLGYLSATDVLNARKQKVGDILLAGEIDGNPYYSSYWLCLKEKPYSSIADLKGKPVGFASRTSTSGYVLPYYDLIKRGLLKPNEDPEVFFGAGNVFYGTGYVSAVERVLSGDVEAAAVSYYVLDKDKHLSVEQRARLRKLQDQGPVPTHVIAVRTNLSDEDRAALKAALLSMNHSDSNELRDKVFTSKLVEVDPAKHLSILSEALELTAKK